MTSFTSESDENLKQYLGGTKELTWLHKKVKAGDFLQFNEGFFHPRFFTKPDLFNDISVYA
jgi:hypothetical protein